MNTINPRYTLGLNLTLDDIKANPYNGEIRTEPACHVTGNLDPVLVVEVRNGLGSKDYYRPMPDGRFVWIGRN